MSVDAVAAVQASKGSVPNRIARRLGLSRFQDVLREAASEPATAKAATRSETYSVRRGDTLWGLCENQLERRGLCASNGAILAAINRVAEANGLSNPDLIMPGQQLDLAAAARDQSAQASAVALMSAVPPPLVPRDPADAVVDSGRAARLSYESLATLRAPRTGAVSPDTASTRAASESPWSALLGGSGRLTSEFGMRKDPFTGLPEHHDGIDIAATQGTAIYPLSAGRVTFSGWQKGYGQVVVVEHANGLETVYGHTSVNLVQEGDMVKKNTVLGRVGSTGRSTGPHLHFEARRNGRAFDPIHLLTKGSFHVAEAL
ncbi:MAG: M23 family metallopeptidase [Candidatus Hydrogenedentes bacterium]|nr:M23 family metallopeptidase [Candidatus Hydrogenedentota bacterium]